MSISRREALSIAFGGMFASACGDKIHWKPLQPAFPDGAKFAGSVEREDLLPVWKKAAEVLDAVDAANEVYIFVWSRETWWNGVEMVGGTQEGPLLTVGPSLAALAHELAHYADARKGIYGETEAQAHARWLRDGTRARLDQFDAWMKSRGK